MASFSFGAQARPALPGPTRPPERRVESRNHRFAGAVWFVLAGVLVVFSAVTVQGADLFWGVAMGDRIRAGHGVPSSVPFAEAPSTGWANPMAIGEMALSLVHSFGPSALVVLHLTLVAAAMAMLVACGVAGNRREARTSLALVLTVAGGVTTLAIARMPSLSLVPYAAVVVLLLREADRPSRRLWLAVPLIGLWGNLHGGVLVGCALLIVHLVCCGGPLLRRAMVGATAIAAVLLATSAGWRTLSYYRGVLGNEAARQHVGLWARINLHSPADALMMLATVGLIALWARSRPRLWEAVAVAGMAAATLLASRNSIWLVLFLLPLAARGRRRAVAEHSQHRSWKPAMVAFLLLLLGTGWQVADRGSALDARGSGATTMVRHLAHGGTVLAISPVDETFAQAGIRVWASNPIDAFPQAVQRQYLAFVDRGAVPADTSIDLVVADHHLAGRVRAAGWTRVAATSGLVIFERPAWSRAASGRPA